MTPLRVLRKSSSGFTLVEMAAAVAVMAVLSSLAMVAWEDFQAHVRYSSVRANMEAIAKAAFTDYANQETWDASNLLGQMPPSIEAHHLLSKWPDPPCPGWQYNWEDWEAAGYSTAWVALRREDTTAYIAYCVATFGGAETACNVDPLHPAGIQPIQIGSNNSMAHNIFCNE